MTMTPEEFGEVFGRYFASLEHDWKKHPSNIFDIAGKHKLLPLHLDMGGFFGLRSDGAVLEVTWDSDKFEVVHDRRRRDIALVLGCRRYPLLSPLIPMRTSGAPECSSCRGTGHFVVDGRSIANVVCSCGGLGWIPEHW